MPYIVADYRLISVKFTFKLKGIMPKRREITLSVITTLICVFVCVLLFALFASYQTYTQANKASIRPNLTKERFLADATLGWKLKPHYSITYTGKDIGQVKEFYSTDSFGFRNPENYTEKALRAMLLGDSFAEGYYLSNEETISEQLGQRLQGPVYNLGVGGYSTDQECILGNAALKKMQSDWVIVLFYINDLPFLSQKSAWGMPKPLLQMGAVQPDFKIVKNSHAAIRAHNEGVAFLRSSKEIFKVNFIENIIKLKFLFLTPSVFLQKVTDYIQANTNRKKYELEDYDIPGQSPYRNPMRFKTEWHLAFQMLKDLEANAKKNNAQLLILFIPEKTQIEYPDLHGFSFQETFLNFCAMNSLKCVEPGKTFLKLHKERPLYWKDDGHLNPQGAQTIAEVLSTAIHQYEK